MTEISYHLVDVFTSVKYGGNQLAVFVDFEDRASDKDMLTIAKELNFSEVSFIKSRKSDENFEVRIFTPEYEVPFAGHPSLGTAFVISKYLLPHPKEQITLNLKHGTIRIQLSSTTNLDQSQFTMEQAAPEFLATFTHEEIAQGLHLEKEMLDFSRPIEEISTGLPYIIVPIKSLEAMDQIQLHAQTVIDFLTQKKKYKTNSATGLSTSLFFVTEETFEKENHFNSRMFCVENGGLIEDAATGSANGCFLAYLLKHQSSRVSAVVEQGFQMGRKSYLYLEGQLESDRYHIHIGGQVVDVSQGRWSI